MTDKIVRTRFAPSPTGFMHVGNLRTALYEYLIAKSQGGKFVLRIEDTDQGRLVEGAIDIIYDTLRQVGLDHDEGPDIGGPGAPYVQSERLSLYKPAADELVAKGQAYYCFCSEERLASLKEEDSHAPYDRHCRELSEEEVQRRLAAGQPYTIRQKMPLSGETVFEDAVYGRIAVQNDELEDQVLLKSDGFPTYNFANVVDDHAMSITHVVRGSEYLSSTPKYNLLYEAFGYELPVYVHLPLILGEDGQKLSKRHGATGFKDLLEEGYLPAAIINYIAMLGWAPPGLEEIYTLEELTQVFSVTGISKSPAIFDYKKLRWFNQEYLRRMTAEEFTALCLPYYQAVLPGERWDYDLISSLLQPRLERLTDIAGQIDFLGDYDEHFDLDFFSNKKMKTRREDAAAMLRLLEERLAALPAWTRESLHEGLLTLAADLAVKNGVVMWPCRIAVAARLVTPGGAVEILALLGREESLRRMDLSRRRLEA